MTSLVIQALKTLGRTNVTAEIRQTLSEKLSEDEKQACLKEATESTDWVYDTLIKIIPRRSRLRAFHPELALQMHDPLCFLLHCLYIKSECGYFS